MAVSHCVIHPKSSCFGFPWSSSLCTLKTPALFSACLLQLKQVPELQRELQTMKMALAEANMDKARLLQEIRKYNPLFQL